MTAKLNHVAIIVAAVAYFVFSAVWFMAFGAQWRAFTGITMAQIAPATFAVSALMGLALAYVTGIALRDSDNPNGVRHGIEFGMFFGIGIWMTNLLSLTMYEHRPIGLWLIDGFQVAIGMALMGAIIGGWRSRA
jgi:hypothetical protein